MPFDALIDTPISTVAAAPEPEGSTGSKFRKPERLVVLTGASAFGALGGFFVAMALGRIELWALLLISAPIFALSFHFTRATLSDALRRGSLGCAFAAGLHAAALLAWPLTALFSPLEAALFWTAPVAALSALGMFSMCWSGSSRAIYRTCAQGAMIALVAAQQGTLVLLG